MSKTNMDKKCGNGVNEEEEDKMSEEEDVTYDSLNSIDSLKDVKTVLSIDIGTKNFGYCIMFIIALFIRLIYMIIPSNPI